MLPGPPPPLAASHAMCRATVRVSGQGREFDEGGPLGNAEAASASCVFLQAVGGKNQKKARRLLEGAM
jgi:hypothetical protein